MNNKKKFLIGIFIILLISVYIYHTYLGRDKIVIIPRNATAKDVGKILKNEKLIPSEGLFRWMVFFLFAERNIKHGTYKFRFSLTTIPIVIRLVRGPQLVKVTIPEGFRVEQIAERLHAKGIILDPIYFITFVKSNSYNGYLFPETYYFSLNEDVDYVVNRMVSEFYRKYSEDLRKRAYELKLTTHQVVVLASIVEKEAKTKEEKRLVSAVFHNRLKKGWYLESCATVRYALKKFTGPLTYKDLNIDSKFNTYKYYGLPPEPICNPGLDSIEAVLYPAETDDMFFFTENNQTHVFSKYYKQHIERQKKSKYSVR
ncbi:MAG: endolytic transglycosylase MltG [Endomicrobia bacterium]|nr:endolytic transglycosylase MltG [Endomicrobiia bacterium]